MTDTTQTTQFLPPVRLVRADDRDRWLDHRLQGITATQVRDIMIGTPRVRRDIVTAKVLGTKERDLTGIAAIDHGNIREPIIAAHLSEKFDIDPNRWLLAAHGNPRHLATPDGVSRTFEVDGIIDEIKTGKDDLTPGPIVNHVLDLSRAFDRSGMAFWREGYYFQIQWQIYVAGGQRALYVWEQHDGYKPLPLRWCWIDRDQTVIDQMVSIANEVLAEVDQFRATGMPPVSAELSSEVMALIHDLLRFRDREATAVEQKKDVWNRLLDAVAEFEPGIFDAVEASLTINQKPDTTTVVPDEDAMRAAAPAFMAKYDALRARHMRTVTTPGKRTVTVTPKRPSL